MNSFIVPLFKATSLVDPLVAALVKLRDAHVGQVDFILVLDGPDDSCKGEILKSARGTSLNLQVISLTRHVGVAGALFAGLASAPAENGVICFGGDLQEPLETLLSLATKVDSGADVVLGQRETRDDGAIADFFSNLYWRLARVFIDKSLPAGGFDVFALSSRARKSLLKLPGARPNITTQLFKLGFPVDYVKFHRVPRVSGKSSWPASKKFGLAIDSLVVTNPSGTTKYLLVNLAASLSSLVIFGSVVLSALPMPTTAKVLLTLSSVGIVLVMITLITFISHQISVLLDELYQASKFEIQETIQLETMD